MHCVDQMVAKFNYILIQNSRKAYDPPFPHYRPFPWLSPALYICLNYPEEEEELSKLIDKRSSTCISFHWQIPMQGFGHLICKGALLAAFLSSCRQQPSPSPSWSLTNLRKQMPMQGRPPWPASPPPSPPPAYIVTFVQSTFLPPPAQWLWESMLKDNFLSLQVFFESVCSFSLNQIHFHNNFLLLSVFFLTISPSPPWFLFPPPRLPPLPLSCAQFCKDSPLFSSFKLADTAAIAGVVFFNVVMWPRPKHFHNHQTTFPLSNNSNAAMWPRPRANIENALGLGLGL